RDDVSLFAVEIGDQSDVRRAIRIIFDLGHTRRNARLVTLEIDDAIEPFVAAASPTNGYTSIVVAARDALFCLEQGLFRLGVWRQFIARQVGLVPSRRGCRCKSLDSHSKIADQRLGARG